MLSQRLGQHKDADRLGHSNNDAFQHVSEANHAINRENIKMVFRSNDSYQRLMVDAAPIKTLPNFNSTQSTLANDIISRSLILKSKP